MKRFLRLLLCICLAGMLAGCRKTDSLSSSSASNQDTRISCPYVFDDDRLVLVSLFSSSIPNPDDDFTEADDIATIQLVNQSGRYLEKATIRLQTADGSVYNFVIEDLPDQQDVITLDTSSQTLNTDINLKDISVDAQYSDRSSMKGIDIAVEGSTITLTNTNENDVENLIVRYHAKLDDQLLGGIAYITAVDRIASGTSVSIEAVDAWTGDAEVAYVGEGK